MKTIMLILTLLSVICSLTGCSTTTPAERSYARIQEAEKMWGPVANWTPRQVEVFKEMQLEAEAQQAERQARAAAAAQIIAQGFQQAGQTVAGAQTDPYILYKMNAGNSSQSGYRSWHNSDGSSGSYVPYPGGNGGTVFNSDGTTTNVDPAIGH